MDTFANQQMILKFLDTPRDEKITEGNRDRVINGLKKLLAGDPDTWWSMYDPDVVFHEAACLPYGGAHKGLPAVKAAFDRLSATYSNIHAVFEEILAAGDIVIAYQTIKATVKANGNKIEWTVAELFRFRNGKVVEWRAHYFDADLVARAIKGT